MGFLTQNPTQKIVTNLPSEICYLWAWARHGMC